MVTVFQNHNTFNLVLLKPGQKKNKKNPQTQPTKKRPQTNEKPKQKNPQTQQTLFVFHAVVQSYKIIACKWSKLSFGRYWDETKYGFVVGFFWVSFQVKTEQWAIQDSNIYNNGGWGKKDDNKEHER